MSDRTLERILADWREAELRLDDHPSDTELAALVERFRSEYATEAKAHDYEMHDASRYSELIRQG